MIQPIKNWEERFDGKFNDFAYLEMPTVNGFTKCIQSKNGMPTSIQEIKSFISQLLSEATREAVEKERERVEKLLVTDFPTAWKILVTKKENHHPKCSWAVAGMLCDCAGRAVFISTIKYIQKALHPKDPINNPKE